MIKPITGKTSMVIISTEGTECEAGIEENLLNELRAGRLPADGGLEVVIPREEVGLALR